MLPMKYTVYVFKCLQSGTLRMGVTHNLGHRLQELQQGTGRRRLIHPELLHVEQYEDLKIAHRRLQAITHQWRRTLRLTNQPSSLYAISSAGISFRSLH